MPAVDSHVKDNQDQENKYVYQKSLPKTRALNYDPDCYRWLNKGKKEYELTDWQRTDGLGKPMFFLSSVAKEKYMRLKPMI